MNRLFTGFFFLILGIVPAFSQGFECFSRDNHFAFYRQDQQDYAPYTRAFNESFEFLCDRLALEQHHHIKVMIFSSQRLFIEKIYGRYEPLITSVGMARSDEPTIYITSFYDQTTGRDLDEYLKVARHELVHLLAPHEKAWLGEGLALYLADQARDFVTYPKNAGELNFYLDARVFNPEAYGYYSWLTRYIISKSGFEAFLGFYLSEGNWNLLGYKDQEDFCKQAFDSLEALRISRKQAN